MTTHTAFKSIALFALSILSYSSSAKDCIDPASVYGASFEVTSDGDHKRKIVVMRETKGRVMYLLSSEHLTRIYENYGKGFIAVIEYFDLEKIGVEYEPSKEVSLNGWDPLYEFFPVALADQLAETAQGQFACIETVTKAGNHEGGQLEVTYLKGLKFPVKVVQSSGEKSSTWKLTELLTDRTLLEKQLNRVENYRLYDFADLGDSENEDFFRNSKYLQYKVHGDGGGHHH